MDFTKKKKSRFTRLEGNRDASKYPHSLQFYTLPPMENISLQEFEEFAIERLKVLTVVEKVGIRSVKGTEEYRENLDKELRTLSKQNIFKGVFIKKPQLQEIKNNEDYDERRKDHISHFILRLAYCRSDELRRWIIQQEMDLFRYRFGCETDASIQKFLELNKLNYSPITEEEKKAVLRELMDSSAHTSSKVEALRFYKVPFTDVLDLVRLRRVYLKSGFAYVPQCDLVLIILTQFRSNLSHALAITQRALPHLEEDGRLLPLLTSLSKRYLGQDYTNKKPTSGAITANMIDGLSKKSFPLCMSQLHQSLRATHHMKHAGRQQYGLFLKAIGMSLEEAMHFWKAEFTKLMDSDKFDKSYSYNIRHNFGKEGKRTNYTPYSCMKIIMSNAPATGDHHGCPFKHNDLDLLKQKMQGLRVSPDIIEEVGELAKRHHYQLACGKYFEFTHNINTGFSPNHPNQYFDESQKMENGGKPDAATPTANRGTPVIRPISENSQQTPLSQVQKPKLELDEFETEFPAIEDLDMAIEAAGC